MKKDNIESISGQTLFVGIDVHKKSFHVTLRTDQIRMGPISRSGKADLRGMLVEAAWIRLYELIHIGILNFPYSGRYI